MCLYLYVFVIFKGSGFQNFVLHTQRNYIRLPVHFTLFYMRQNNLTEVSNSHFLLDTRHYFIRSTHLVFYSARFKSIKSTPIKLNSLLLFWTSRLEEKVQAALLPRFLSFREKCLHKAYSFYEEKLDIARREEFAPTEKI